MARNARPKATATMPVLASVAFFGFGGHKKAARKAA
jgi:hypothetical protein